MENLKKKVAIIFNTRDIENLESILSGGLGKKIMEVLRLVEKAGFVEKESNMIALAEAQLLGFYHCYNNRSDIRGLIISMGLKKTEWNKLKKEYQLEYINELDKNEIERYFSTQKH